ncbi:unnamed protein product [Peniophora sp. CBMAI 1063]|nr:unnamed protein product [Peniophora sp. CBMAI 1063]
MSTTSALSLTPLSTPIASSSRSGAWAKQTLPSPPQCIAPQQSPFLKASLGALRFYANAYPAEYTIGCSPDNELVLSGPFSQYLSRKHCSLKWDGICLTITDLQTVNGTWVNLVRLSDGEARVLRDEDVVYLTFAPFGLRSRDACKSTLALTYREHTSPDISTAHSPIGSMVREAMDEFTRIRGHIRNTRRIRSDKEQAVDATSPKERMPIYRGVLDRPGRVRTPVLPPPRPLDREEKTPFIPGWRWGVKLTSETEGMRRDDPNIIYGTSLVNLYSGFKLPEPIKRWSYCHHLPVGLHEDWPLISSTPYGCRSSLPWRKRRERYLKYLSDTGRPDFAPDHSGSVLSASRYADVPPTLPRDSPKHHTPALVDDQKHSSPTLSAPTDSGSSSRASKRPREEDYADETRNKRPRSDARSTSGGHHAITDARQDAQSIAMDNSINRTTPKRKRQADIEDADQRASKRVARCIERRPSPGDATHYRTPASILSTSGGTRSENEGGRGEGEEEGSEAEVERMVEDAGAEGVEGETVMDKFLGWFGIRRDYPQRSPSTMVGYI